MVYRLQIIYGVELFRYNYILLNIFAFVHWVWKFNG